ncbi:15428_t:CDS:1, partial [Acaulospora colombiana]
QVVTEQLHNEGRVLVALLRQCVELGNGIVKCLLGKMASTVGRVEYFIVKDGKVEGETEADGVCGWKLSDGNVGRIGNGQSATHFSASRHNPRPDAMDSLYPINSLSILSLMGLAQKVRQNWSPRDINAQTAT